jgi:hypothetical protein
MRWFRIRKAQVSPEFRQYFEERGVETMRAYVAVPHYSITEPDGTVVTERQIRPQLTPWLTEQYDRAERKETWSITMEFMITIFVGFDLVLSIVRLVHGR